VSLLGEVQFGREICGDLDAAEQREWLVTNGLGGFASGTAAGTATRRYHGLLFAALKAPVGRTLLVAALDETARYLDNSYSLATNRWMSGFLSPSGFLQIEGFHLEGMKPVWRYAFADAILEKRIWMKQDENTTYAQYTLVRGNAPVDLECKVLVSYRDFHSTAHADGWHMQIDPVEKGLKVAAFDGAVPYYLKSDSASCQPNHEWYRDYFLPAERQRGLDDHEDRLYAATFRAHLLVGQSVTLVFSTESSASLDADQARTDQSNHEWKLYKSWQTRHAAICKAPPADEPSWLWQLVLAADQFIVKRATPKNPDGRTILAGYHWFADWGRDAMIALPGLTLALGRPDIARGILRSSAAYVDGGMIPNNFPDDGSAPQYNSVDAALWFFEAARQYFEATKDFRCSLALSMPMSAALASTLKWTPTMRCYLLAVPRFSSPGWTPKLAIGSSPRVPAKPSKSTRFGSTPSTPWPSSRANLCGLATVTPSLPRRPPRIFRNSGIRSAIAASMSSKSPARETTQRFAPIKSSGFPYRSVRSPIASKNPLSTPSLKIFSPLMVCALSPRPILLTKEYSPVARVNATLPIIRERSGLGFWVLSRSPIFASTQMGPLPGVFSSRLVEPSTSRGLAPLVRFAAAIRHFHQAAASLKRGASRNSFAHGKNSAPSIGARNEQPASVQALRRFVQFNQHFACSRCRHQKEIHPRSIRPAARLRINRLDTKFFVQ
jgi:hypothetical protein